VVVCWKSALLSWILCTKFCATVMSLSIISVSVFLEFHHWSFNTGQLWCFKIVVYSGKLASLLSWEFLMILLLTFNPPCHIYCSCAMKFCVLLKSLHASPCVTSVLTVETISLPAKSLAFAFLSRASVTGRRIWLYVKQTVALTHFFFYGRENERSSFCFCKQFYVLLL